MAIKETIPFNFDDTYAFIANKFAERGYDTQEGSNTMQLVTAMSYLTSMLNVNTAININETLLTLARKRKMVLQDARVLGYEAAHAQSYQYDLVLRLSNTQSYPVKKNIEKYSGFASSGHTYWYLGQTLNITVPPESYEDVTIRVIEGNLYKFTDDPQSLVHVIEEVFDSAKNQWYNRTYIDIPYTNVEDTHGLEVFLTYYDAEAKFFEQEVWTRSKQFMIDSDVLLNKEYIRLDDVEYGTPRIHFKLGDVGKELRAGTIVQVNVLTSSGASGEMTGMPGALDLDVDILSYKLIISGTGEEPIESIKKNAPMFHNSANRAITRPDYIAFANRHPAVRFTEVWDGNAEYPKIRGHIWFSFIPQNTKRIISDDHDPGYSWELQYTFEENYENFFLEDSEIADVFRSLDNYKVPTLIFHHRHPVYVDFKYDVKIARYTGKSTKPVANRDVFNVINEYFRSDIPTASVETNAELFEFEYFHSNLVKRVDLHLTDITGVDLNLATTMTLFEVHIIKENTDNSDNVKNDKCEIKFHLGIPFEGIFDKNQNIIFENLPDISTSSVIVDPELGAKRLYVDKTLSTVTSIRDDKVSILPIRMTDWDGKERLYDEIIGEYKVFNHSTPDIEVTLFVTSGDGNLKSYESSYTTGINPGHLRIKTTDGVIDKDTSGITLEIKYPSNNIVFTKNSIPRLNTVRFS